jgi:cell wall-associated NlpC family hydrolase
VDSTAARVVSLARSLLATPYRYAGSDPKGFDCSGLTSYVFEKVGLSLPRTAQTQAAAGRWVAPDELHVGVVVSEPGEPLSMIHASSSRGVTETAVLTNSYWLPRLRFGRRVLAAD